MMNPISAVEIARLIDRLAWEKPAWHERVVEDPELVECLWFIQWASCRPRGLERLAEEIIERFPSRLGPPAMRRWWGQKLLSPEQTAAVWQESPE